MGLLVFSHFPILNYTQHIYAALEENTYSEGTRVCSIK